MSRAEHGQDPNFGTGRDSGYRSNQGYGSNTGGGVASYIPGTEANRVSRAEHGQDPNRYTSGNVNTGTVILAASPVPITHVCDGHHQPCMCCFAATGWLVDVLLRSPIGPDAYSTCLDGTVQTALTTVLCK